MADVKVGIQITADSQDAALLELITKMKAAQTEIKNTGGAAQEAERGFSVLQNTLGKLAVAVGGLFALSKIKDFLVDNFHAAIDNARAMDELRMALHSLAGASAEEVERVNEWMDGMEKASGYVNDRLTPAMITLLGVTKNTAESQRLLEIAAGAARRGVGELESNAYNLAAALSGRVVRGVDDLSIRLREAAKDGKITKEEMAALAVAYGDAGAGVANTAAELDRSKASWDNTKEALGGMYQGIVTAMLPALKALAIALGLVATGLELATGKLRANFAEYSYVAPMLKALATGHLDAAKAIEAQARAEGKRIWEGAKQDAEDAMTAILTAWDNKMPPILGGKGAKGSFQDHSLKGSPAGTSGSKAAGSGVETQTEAAAVQALAKADRDLAAAMLDVFIAEQRAATGSRDIAAATDAAMRARQSLYEKDLAALRQGSAKELAQENLTAKAKEAILRTANLREEKLARDLQKDLLQIQRDGANKLLKEQQAALDRREQGDSEEAKNALKWDNWLRAQQKRTEELHLKDIKKMDLQELAEHHKELTKELELKRKLGQDETQVAADIANTEVQIDRLSAQQRLDIATQTLAGLLGAASAAFGNNKALAIAETVISTYSAAQKSYEAMASIPYVGPALGIAAAATAVLAGVARVQQIESTNASASAAGGYDIPAGVNPIVQTHQQEMILPADIAIPLRAALSGRSSITYDQRATSHYRQRGGDLYVTQNLLSGARGDYAAREVAKEVRKGEKMLARLTPARRLRQTGSTRDYTRRAQ